MYENVTRRKILCSTNSIDNRYLNNVRVKVHSENIPYPRIFYCVSQKWHPFCVAFCRAINLPARSPLIENNSSKFESFFPLNYFHQFLHSHTTLYITAVAAYDVTALLHTAQYTQLPVIIPPRLLFTLLIPFRWNENVKFENQISFNGKLNIKIKSIALQPPTFVLTHHHLLFSHLHRIE